VILVQVGLGKRIVIARGSVGRRCGLEAQAELHGGVDEGQDRVEGHAQPLGAVAEVQRDRKALIGDVQPSNQCWMTMVISSG
jgi:hypothetical protein